MSQYPEFVAALLRLGKTRGEIAAVLDTSPKTVDRLRKDLPEQLKQFRRAPHLLRVLADEMERQEQQAA